MKRLFTLISLFFIVLVLYAQDEDFSQVGIASVYSDQYEGRRTANGEVFTHEKFTAAHLSIPFGTKVKVTNMKTRKFVIVTINDRGPFVKDRILDLSRAAAFKIDIDPKGTEKVQIQVLKPTKRQRKKNKLTVKSEEPKKEEEPKEEPKKEEPKKEEPKKVETKVVRDTVYVKQVVRDTVYKTKTVYVNNGSQPTPENHSGIYRIIRYEIGPKINIRSGYAIQVGYYHVPENAYALYKRLRKKYKTNIYLHRTKEEGQYAYRLLFGVYTHKSQALRMLPGIRRYHRDAFIQDYSTLEQ